MKTKIGSGDVLDITAPSGGTTSGVGVLIGTALFGIAVATVAQGGVSAIHTTGVFDHAAATHATDQAWTVGMPVYWDNTNKVVTKTATDNTLIGYAVEAKVSTAAVGRFRLTV